jgi:hypothetical protein
MPLVQANPMNHVTPATLEKQRGPWMSALRNTTINPSCPTVTTTPQPLGSTHGSKAITSEWRTSHTLTLGLKRPSTPEPLTPSSTEAEAFVTTSHVHTTTSSNHPSVTHALHLHATPTHLPLLQTSPTQEPEAAQSDPHPLSPPRHRSHRSPQTSTQQTEYPIPQISTTAPKRSPGRPRKAQPIPSTPISPTQPAIS